MYDSTSSGQQYDPEQSFELEEPPNASVPSSAILSPTYVVAPSPSETEFMTPNLDYSPSSPTDSNPSITTGKLGFFFYNIFVFYTYYYLQIFFYS